ncbi:hypothetical protein E4665_16070 [Sporolactobacillus shoreae]|uniref:Uncharacterized protein n=1 Tax=Sporolactobacillus shoreae TaxID=1465501 RepID=A0A4Z0GK24_9BACL|nr:hypothetical protein [Sporolactobacillus shoreae]TGA96289.1 hypothetical protein E4665_16070 [Sporolactobacillus shoreae]
MSRLDANEAFRLIHHYMVKVEREEVDQWLKEDPAVQSDTEGIMDEAWMYRFNAWLQCKGTAHEMGIDPQTKIDRLLDEIDRLKQEIKQLKSEKLLLEAELGQDPF